MINMPYRIFISALFLLSGCASLPVDKKDQDMQNVLSFVNGGRFEEARTKLNAITPTEKNLIIYEINSLNHDGGKFVTLFPKEIIDEYLQKLIEWKKKMETSCPADSVHDDEHAYNLEQCYSSWLADPSNLAEDYAKNDRFNRKTYEVAYSGDMPACSGHSYMAYCSPFGSSAKEILRAYKEIVSTKARSNIASIEEQKRISAEKTEAERKSFESTPKYQKCTAMADNYEVQGMLQLWNQNLTRQKANVSMASGMASNQMVAEIEKSVGMINGLNFRFKRNNDVIKSLRLTPASEAECKKLIENFGSSTADAYK